MICTFKVKTLSIKISNLNFSRVALTSVFTNFREYANSNKTQKCTFSIISVQYQKHVTHIPFNVLLIFVYVILQQQNNNQHLTEFCIESYSSQEIYYQNIIRTIYGTKISMSSDTKTVTLSSYPFGTQASQMHNYLLTKICSAVKRRKNKGDDAAAWKFPNQFGQRKTGEGLESRLSGKFALFRQESRKADAIPVQKDGIKRHAEHRKIRSSFRFLSNTTLGKNFQTSINLISNGNYSIFM